MKLSSEQRRRVGELVAELKQICGGEKNSDGRAKTFAQLEDECIELGDLLTVQLLERRIKECVEPPDDCTCPECRRSIPREADDEARVMQTDRGEIGYTEPAYHCRHCRRSFFPEVGRIRNRRRRHG